MKRYTLFFLMLSGCAGFQTIPFQDRATDMVWRQTYAVTDHDPPPVDWIGGKALDCYPDPKTGAFEAFLGAQWYGGPAGTQCDGGLYWDGADVAQVALYPTEPDFLFSASSFAHELNHARLFYTVGDGDAGHTDVSWRPGGLLDQANTALVAAGL